MALFSSTENTAACWGGLTYRPITSAAFVSKSGSFDAKYRSMRCGLSPRPPPDASDHHVIRPKVLRELPRRPVGRAIRWATSRPVENAGLEPRRSFLDGPPLMTGEEPGQTIVDEPALPPGHEGRVAPQHRLYRRVGLAIGQHENEPSPPDVVGSQLPRAYTGFQRVALSAAESE